MVFIKVGENIKENTDMKFEILKEVLSDRQNRLLIGSIMLSIGIGIGGGLITSAYVRVPM